jgi:hypothetical protein
LVYVQQDDAETLKEVHDAKLFVIHRFAEKLRAAQVRPLPACAWCRGALAVNILPRRVTTTLPAICRALLQMPYKIHIVVATTDADTIASIISRKAQVWWVQGG